MAPASGTAQALLVLSGHPLSAASRAGIEEQFSGSLTFQSLPELRRLPLAGLFRFLRSLSPDRCLLAYEDRESVMLLPLLEVMAACTRSGHVDIVDPTYATRRVGRLHALQALGAVAVGTAKGLWSVQRASAACDRLLGAPPQAFAPVQRGAVVYLSTNLWFGPKAGGSVGHIAGVVNGFQRLGWPVTYASITSPHMLDPDVHVHMLPLPRSYGFPSQVNDYRSNERLVPALSPAVESIRPAFIYQRMSVGNYAGVLLSRRCAVPLVLEYNGSQAWVDRHWSRDGRAGRFSSVVSKAEDVCLRHAHRVVTVSEVLADELVQRGVSRDRVVWYPNGVDETVFDHARFPSATVARLRASADLGPDDLVITFVGTFGKWHGVEVLARAVADLVATDRSWLTKHRVRFLFVGDGAMMPNVRDSVDTPDCRPFVRLTGIVGQSQAPVYLAASDILVSPHVRNPDGSRFFGSPTKLFEYLAMGRPVLGSRLDQVGDVLSPGLDAVMLPGPTDQPRGDAHAVLAEPGSEKELIAGLRFLVERPEWRSHLGRNASAHVRSRYLWRHHVEAILASLGHG